MSFHPSIDELKQAIISSLDIAGFYAGYISDNQNLYRARSDGWSERVRCPIHDDQASPNFFINTVTGQYRCHACGSGGSIFDFVININRRSTKDPKAFEEALAIVATAARIDIKDWRRRKEATAGLPNEIVKGGDVKLEAANAKQQPKRLIYENDKANKPIPEDVVNRLHMNLEPRHWQYLSEVRGINREEIERLKIGFDPTSPVKNEEENKWVNGRYVIPVRNKKGEVRNLRLYSNIAASRFKMINYVVDKGTKNEIAYGRPARLYGIEEVTQEKKNVVLCEGEWDRILLNMLFRKHGYQSWVAVTGTGGCNTFREEWIEDFRGINFFVCLDCDEEGKLAALEISGKYLIPALSQGNLATLKIITLPLEGTKSSKDISDYFLKERQSIKDFIELVENTPNSVPGGFANQDASVAPVKVSSLDYVLRERRFIDMKVEVPLTIASSAEKIYHAIRSYKVSHCPLMKDGHCCSQDAGERRIPYGHSMFIASCMEKEDRVVSQVRSMACHEDEKCTLQITSKVVMEEYFAHQIMKRKNIGIDAEDAEDSAPHTMSEMTHVAVYFLQPEERVVIEPKDYIAVGWIRTHPKTMAATLFIESLSPVEDDFRKFSLENPDTREMIRIIKEEFTTEELLSEITNGVTKIFHSDEILWAILLTYLCPIYFDFNGSRMRGWITTVIVGDSGVGKSKMYERLADWVGVGMYFGATTGSRTGLIWATKNNNGQWFTTAGDYVKASGKIILVDEVQTLDKEVTTKLGTSIDRGFLEVKNVSTGGYHAQVRAIFLMNPVDENGEQTTISHFSYGVESLRHCFNPMFIRRLDIAVFRSRREEYDYNKYAGTPKEKYNTRLTSSQLRALIYWAWTREPKHVIWGEEETRHCLEAATIISRKFGYADSVPLVSPNDFRENLARLCVAFAILDRSFTEDLTSVVIKKDHVDIVSGFIDAIYSSQDCNLNGLSEKYKKMNQLGDYDDIENMIFSMLQSDSTSNDDSIRLTFPTARLLMMLHDMGKFSIYESPVLLGVPISFIRRKCTQLQAKNLVQPSDRSSFQVTRKFNLFMSKWRSKEGVEEYLNQMHSIATGYISKNQQVKKDQQVKSKPEMFPGESNGEIEIEIPHSGGRKFSYDPVTERDAIDGD